MHPLEYLDFPIRVAKRAQYEAFEFDLLTDGILVRNCSHPVPSDHEYLVTIENGLPTDCTCPADQQDESACKHRVAVAIRRPLLDAMATDPHVVADGGQTDPITAVADFEIVTDQRTDGNDPDVATEDCEECIGDFPCWECVRTGRKELPD